MKRCRLAHGSSESDDGWHADSSAHLPAQTSGWQHVAGVFDPTTEGTLDSSHWNARHLSRLYAGRTDKGLSDEQSEHQCVLEEIAQLREELGLHVKGNTSD
eukprot:COSAG02_NODE_2382_length_8992_cov_5.447318_4_plen_101_part_00